MNHKFTARETLLILICAVLALGIFYYEFAYKNLKKQIDSYSTENLTDELTVAQAKMAKYQQMKKAIADGSKSKGTVAVYNNQTAEIAELGDILNNSARNIKITWDDPTLSGTTVRRNAEISFDTTGYTTARHLVDAIINCKFRNVATDIEIKSNTDLPLSNSDDITSTMTVTFFETTTGAASTKGLTADSSAESAEDSTESGTTSTSSSADGAGTAQ